MRVLTVPFRMPGGARSITVRKFSIGAGVSPADDHVCPACGEPFGPGRFFGLVPLGPGADAAARERCARGQAYNAEAIAVHWACMTGEADETGGARASS